MDKIVFLWCLPENSGGSSSGNHVVQPTNLFQYNRFNKLSDKYYWFCYMIFILALTRENACKPPSSSKYYRELSGDWIHNVQTGANSPAASCQARTFHITETMITDHPSAMRGLFHHTCYFFQLHICWFDFDILEIWKMKTHLTHKGADQLSTISRPCDSKMRCYLTWFRKMVRRSRNYATQPSFWYPVLFWGTLFCDRLRHNDCFLHLTRLFRFL